MLDAGDVVVVMKAVDIGRRMPGGAACQLVALQQLAITFGILAAYVCNAAAAAAEGDASEEKVKAAAAAAAAAA
ncbi:MAG: hypothetical protein VXW25_06290, partial [Pseudomonadota bacterium]|nr:hypothetical protein [Pseudomonadota bacterium]